MDEDAKASIIVDHFGLNEKEYVSYKKRIMNPMRKQDKTNKLFGVNSRRKVKNLLADNSGKMNLNGVDTDGYNGEKNLQEGEDLVVLRMRNGLFLYEKIKDLGIEHIKAIGYTLYKAVFENVGAANEYVLSGSLASVGLRAFNPKGFVESYGVLRNIYKYLNEKEIKENIRSEIKVTSVMRFRRKIRSENGESRFKGTFAIKVGLAGGNIPNEVILNYTILKVDLFVPQVRQCLNCGGL